MPIQPDEFRRMARYGRVGLQAVVLISRPGASPAPIDQIPATDV
jgi:hypothetical protein